MREPCELSGAQPAFAASHARPAGARRQPRRGVLGAVSVAGAAGALALTRPTKTDSHSA
ncbi:twin-arginine translocation signal domain-containing protein [Cronobacter dublinensis]|nr:twin-arginine translocation signal domain-containing protein [Cronobacter dublinensis]